MKLEIEINDKELQEEMKVILSRQLVSEYTSERKVFKREIAKAVKEVVYSEKASIIEMVVNRATTEIVKKSVPELLNKIIKLKE